MTTPLERPIVVAFSSKEQVQDVASALAMFVRFLADKYCDDEDALETAKRIHEIVEDIVDQWDCGKPDCDDCKGRRDAEQIAMSELQRVLGMPRAGDA